MELFKIKDVNINLQYQISYSCLLNEEVYVCSMNGIIYKYQIKRNNFEVNFELEEEYLIKKNKKINKIFLIEKLKLILILVEDALYFVQNMKFNIINLINKYVNGFYINENNQLELIVHSKKKLYLYKYENNYKLFKEINFVDIIYSLIWMNNLLFISMNKQYQIYNLKNQETLILYHHEIKQTYKYITLINFDEIFIVCDSNIGVFYNTRTLMPSQKNTINLSDNIKYINVYNFFLCCLSLKEINIYNIKNQEHIECIKLDEPMEEIINYNYFNRNIIDFNKKENIKHEIEKKEISKYFENNIYLINNKKLKMIQCIDLYEYLHKCITHNKIEKGFIFIEHYNFLNNEDKLKTLNEYKKICGYYYFKNLKFSLAFLHFDKLDINIVYLISFWIHLLPEKYIEKIKLNEIRNKDEWKEKINVNFEFVLPSLYKIDELIDKEVLNYIEKNKNIIYNEENTTNNLTKQTEEIKKQLLYLANNCLIKFLLKKRNEHIENIKLYLEENLNENNFIYLNHIIDIILFKLMVINNHSNLNQFIMNTENLNLDKDECIHILKTYNNLTGIFLLYLRYKDYENVIDICTYFFYYYTHQKDNMALNILKNVELSNFMDNLKNKEMNNDNEYMLNILENKKYLWLNTILEKQNFKNKKNILKEMYQILLIFNDKIHHIIKYKEKIKKLYEYVFPILINYNETFFFDFIINENFILNPKEIINILKELEKKNKVDNKKIKYYIHKYVINYLKYDKTNISINTAFIDFYMDHKDDASSQKKIIKFLQNNYPVDIHYLIEKIKEKKNFLIKIILYGKTHLHWNSLDILIEHNIEICEKYCHYYNSLLNKIFKKIDDDTYEKVYLDIFNDEKNAYINMLKKYDINNIENFHFSKKKKKGNISKKIKEYHKFNYINMNKNMLIKLKKAKNKNIYNKEQEKESEEENNIENEEKKEKKENKSEQNGEKEEIEEIKIEKKENKKDYYQLKDKKKWIIKLKENKNEIDFMLKLLDDEEESDSSIDYDITNINKKTTYYDTDYFNSSSSNELNISSTHNWNNLNQMSSSSESNKNLNINKKKKNNQNEKNEKNEKQNKKENIHNEIISKNIYINKYEQSDLLNSFDIYNSFSNRSPGLLFLLIKICMNKYIKENKPHYKNYILYILNKYCNHNDFNNIYIFNLIPNDWNISDIQYFINFNLKKKINTNMNMHIYHNLLKSHYLNISYDVIKEKEKKIIIKEDTTCHICKKIINEISFAYFPEDNIIIHTNCLNKYNKNNN